MLAAAASTISFAPDATIADLATYLRAGDERLVRPSPTAKTAARQRSNLWPRRADLQSGQAYAWNIKRWRWKRNVREQRE